MRNYLNLLLTAFLFVSVFAAITYTFFPGQIKNATTLTDYVYFGAVTTTTLGYGDMAPTTTAAKLWVSAYVLSVAVFVFWVALNALDDIKLPFSKKSFLKYLF